MDELLNIMYPSGIENLSLPDPELLTFYRDVEDRIIWVDTEISTMTLELIRYILRWNKEDKGKPKEERVPIKLFFFSPGGDLDVNYSVIDMIRLSETPVIGVNVGQCASAAAFIYLSCHKRYMLPHAYWLFHEGSGAMQGTYQQTKAAMEDYEKQVKELSSLMVDCTSYTEDEIKERITGEWYVRRDEAIKNGVCEKVIESLTEIL